LTLSEYTLSNVSSVVPCVGPNGNIPALLIRISLAVSEFDRSSCHLPLGARSTRLEGQTKKIRVASCCADFGNGLLSALHFAAYYHDMVIFDALDIKGHASMASRIDNRTTGGIPMASDMRVMAPVGRNEVPDSA
jgi:hypothetical protein